MFAEVKSFTTSAKATPSVTLSVRSKRLPNIIAEIDGVLFHFVRTRFPHKEALLYGGVKVSTGILKRDKRVEVGNLFKNLDLNIKR